MFSNVSPRTILLLGAVTATLAIATMASIGDRALPSARAEAGSRLTRPSGFLVADHQAADAFPSISTTAIDRARRAAKIFYGHTSHGSQILTGMNLLARDASRYGYNNGEGSLSITEFDGDLGSHGDTHWAQVTRSHLRGPGRSRTNVIMWSWCGGVSDTNHEGIRAYLDAMSSLERQFPNVIFIYQTGHTDGSGRMGNLRRGNEQIREYCRVNGKILYDFADIEMWDPDGAYYPDTNDGCRWCSQWCRTHRSQCPRCRDCAHSHCFNCLRKGQAFWWLLARLTGWSG